MLLALCLVAGIADWVPIRWTTSDPTSLELVKDTPVNCLLLERRDWSPQFIHKAQESGIATLGVVRPDAGALDAAQEAVAKKLNGVVLEGDFDTPAVARYLTDSRMLTIELPSRARLQLASTGPVVGSYQGVWPGIQVEEGGSTKAAPSGAPWIDTNTGFLRFLRAATGATVWIANRPPEKRVFKPERYLQAIADAAITGSR